MSPFFSFYTSNNLDIKMKVCASSPKYWPVFPSTGTNTDLFLIQKVASVDSARAFRWKSKGLPIISELSIELSRGVKFFLYKYTIVVVFENNLHLDPFLVLYPLGALNWEWWVISFMGGKVISKTLSSLQYSPQISKTSVLRSPDMPVFLFWGESIFLFLWNLASLLGKNKTCWVFF